MAKDNLVQAAGRTGGMLMDAIGTDRFYATNSRPLLVGTPDQEGTWPAWLLDVTELSSGQLLGLMKMMAAEGPVTASMVHELTTIGFPVPAEDCELVRNKPENFFARDARR